MTDHQEQQACKWNIDHSWQIPLGQLDKHKMTDPVEDILKQFENQTQQNETYSHNEQLNNVPAGTGQVTYHMKACNTIPQITITKERLQWTMDKKTV